MAYGMEISLTTDKMHVIDSINPSLISILASGKNWIWVKSMSGLS